MLHAAAFTARGAAPAAARSTRHTMHTQPQHLVAVKVRLGHRQAMPELVNVLGKARRGKVVLLVPQVKKTLRYDEVYLSLNSSC